MKIFVPVIAVLGMSLPWTVSANENAVSDNDSALVVVSGNDSRISAASYRRVEIADEWRTTWLEHLGLKGNSIFRPSMEIDFERCIVVAIFGGETWNCNGYRVESVSDRGRVVVVTFSEIGYQTGGPDGGGDRTNPYAFVVLPNSKSPVVLEQVFRTLNVNDPPTVKEVARLNAGDD